MIFGAVVFGMVLAGGLNLTPAGFSAPQASSSPSAVTLPGGQTVPSFADLAESSLPAVVSIDAVTIEKAKRDRDQQQGNPFEFFFGPRGKGQRQPPQQQQPQDEGDDQSPQGPQEFRSDSGGSGFVISADGLIVTNFHVVEGSSKVTVHLGDRRLQAEIKGTDPATDLALLKVDAGAPIKFLPLGNSDRLRVGEWVMAIGNPLLLEQTVTVGVVSAKGRRIGINDSSFENFIQTDAAINRGNSGGPLLNTAGEVVGINTAMNWGANSIGFAVPVNTLSEILQQLKDKGRVSRGYLGIRIGNLDEEQAQAFGLPNNDGALVASVDPQTPAAQSGVEHGDIIVSVDGHKVRETRDLINYVSNKGPGATVTLDILRDGKHVERKVKLGERPGADEAAEKPAEKRDRGFAWMGLDYQDLTPALRNGHGIAADVQGVFVADVTASSPLVDKLVRPGDVVTEVNGSAVRTVDDFEKAVGGVKAGGFLRLYLRRFDPRDPKVVNGFFAIVRVP
ncbi:MAG: Do family serine endopeptidase [Acidobacteriota bacterium]